MKKRKWRFLLIDTTRSENHDYIVERLSQRADTVEEAADVVTRRICGLRKASEFARCYGSKARVAFVKSLPCAWCGNGPSDNAHTGTDGMGRKASYTKIAPLFSEEPAA